MDTRIRWLRRAVPQLRSLLGLASKPRIRIVLANVREIAADGLYIRVTPDTAIIFIDQTLRSRSALAALAHELLHVHHGIGHSRQWARAAKSAGFTLPYSVSEPRPGLRKRLSKISKSLGPYPNH